MECVLPLPGGWAAQMPFAGVGNSSSWGHVEYGWGGAWEKGPASGSAQVFSQAGESRFLKGFPMDGVGRGPGSIRQQPPHQQGAHSLTQTARWPRLGPCLRC